MELGFLHPALSRYNAAYEKYRECSDRVSNAYQHGSMPSYEELDAEDNAVEQLAAARRGLLDAIDAKLRPRTQ